MLAQVGAFRNDGANGTLPVLNPAELHQLQARLFVSLFRRGEGRDGVQVIRASSTNLIFAAAIFFKRGKTKTTRQAASVRTPTSSRLVFYKNCPPSLILLLILLLIL